MHPVPLPSGEGSFVAIVVERWNSIGHRDESRILQIGITTSSPRVTAARRSVFINCPFDAEFRPSFEALLFAITASGYRPCCALEENDKGDIRFGLDCVG